MKRLYLLALQVAFGMGTASMLRADHYHHFSITNETVAQTTDGAFRDGLYLGRLAAEHGSKPHVASGRWSTLEDRVSFGVGYHRGYSKGFASQGALTTPRRLTE
jgi:hypothetical protein